MATLVAGIDEVGYGPILGPLVVASSIFLINENSEDDMWFRLQNSIGKTKKGLGSRLLVTDSKKAWSKNAKINQLERTTKAFINQLDLKGTISSSRLMSCITNDTTIQVKKYPWYRAAYNSIIPEISTGISNKLTNNMKQEGIEFIDFRCFCIDVEQYNLAVSFTGNKSTVVANLILKLIYQIISLATFYQANKIIIYSDRLGGRTYYANLIERIPNYRLYEINEANKLSTYKLNKLISTTGRKKDLHIQFEVGADDKRFPVALASMAAKYIREKVMEHMNKYFKMLQPNLKPTAGYWMDGLRFLRDIEESGTLYASGLDIKSMRRIK